MIQIISLLIGVVLPGILSLHAMKRKKTVVPKVWSRAPEGSLKWFLGGPSKKDNIYIYIDI